MTKMNTKCPGYEMVVTGYEMTKVGMKLPGYEITWVRNDWQPVEVRKVELQICGRQGRTEVRKRNFTSLNVPAEMKYGSGHPYFEVLAEQVWKMNEIFRSPSRAEVRKAEFQIYGSQGRTEVRKLNFTSLKVPTETKCGSGLTNTWKSWQNKC